MPPRSHGATRPSPSSRKSARVAWAVATLLLTLGCHGGAPTLAGEYEGTWTDDAGRSGVVALEVTEGGKLRANLDSEQLTDVVLAVGNASEAGSVESTCRFSRGTQSLDFPGDLALSKDGERLDGSFRLMTQSPFGFKVSLQRVSAYRQYPSHAEVAPTPTTVAQQPAAPPPAPAYSGPLDPNDNAPATLVCPDCKGEGTIHEDKTVTVSCKYCNGRGWRLGFNDKVEKCWACMGSGTQEEVQDSPHQCGTCRGAGRISEGHLAYLREHGLAQ